MLGSLIARAEAQVRRLSVLYALADSSKWITAEHLNAAHAFWCYCRGIHSSHFRRPHR